MTRKTRRTIRREPPAARQLMDIGNELDRLSRRAHALATRVADAEHDSHALQSMLVTTKQVRP